MSILPDAILAAGLAAARPAAGSEGRLYYSTDTPILERDTGVAWEQFAPVGGGGLFESYCCIVDEKAQNTLGGTFTQGAWRTRDINTEQADPDGIVAIGTNDFVLDAGTYVCWIVCPAYYVTSHQSRLYNVTGAALLVLGQSSYSQNPGAGSDSHSIIYGRFTVAGAQTLEIQHYCTATYADHGFGVRANITDEIYTIAKFLKES